MPLSPEDFEQFRRALSGEIPFSTEIAAACQPCSLEDLLPVLHELQNAQLLTQQNVNRVIKYITSDGRGALTDRQKTFLEKRNERVLLDTYGFQRDAFSRYFVSNLTEKLKKLREINILDQALFDILMHGNTMDTAEGSYILASNGLLPETNRSSVIQSEINSWRSSYGTFEQYASAQVLLKKLGISDEARAEYNQNFHATDSTITGGYHWLIVGLQKLVAANIHTKLDGDQTVNAILSCFTGNTHIEGLADAVVTLKQNRLLAKPMNTLAILIKHGIFTKTVRILPPETAYLVALLASKEEQAVVDEEDDANQPATPRPDIS